MTKYLKRQELLKQFPINNNNIVRLGSLASGINPFVFQKLVNQSTTNRQLDNYKLQSLIKEYKIKHHI